MTTETKLRGGLVLTILVLLWFTLMWSNSIITVKEQKNKIDKTSPPLNLVSVVII